MFTRTKIQKFMGSKKKGFSLVELVVVMAIIGILLMVMAPNYAGFIDEAKGVGVKSDARTLQTMIELVRVETTLADDLTIEAVSTTLPSSTAGQNLGSFITELAGKSAGWNLVKISELPALISGSMALPEPTP